MKYEELHSAYVDAAAALRHIKEDLSAQPGTYKLSPHGQADARSQRQIDLRHMERERERAVQNIYNWVRLVVIRRVAGPDADDLACKLVGQYIQKAQDGAEHAAALLSKKRIGYRVRDFFRSGKRERVRRDRYAESRLNTTFAEPDEDPDAPERIAMDMAVGKMTRTHHLEWKRWLFEERYIEDRNAEAILSDLPDGLWPYGGKTPTAQRIQGDAVSFRRALAKVLRNSNRGLSEEHRVTLEKILERAAREERREYSDRDLQLDIALLRKVSSETASSAEHRCFLTTLARYPSKMSVAHWHISLNGAGRAQPTTDNSSTAKYNYWWSWRQISSPSTENKTENKAIVAKRETPEIASVITLPLANATASLSHRGDSATLAIGTPHGSVSADVSLSRDEATGWHAQFPSICFDPDKPVTLRAARFRPGPARELLAKSGTGVDRAYSPRAYVVTVGESVLRSLFGWAFRDCAKELHFKAMDAGIGSARQLMSLLGSDDLFDTQWVLNLSVATNIQTKQSSSTLGALMDGLGDPPTDRLGAEIDTLACIEDAVLSPSDKDIFVLIPTATTTSYFSARLIHYFLQARYPMSRIDILASPSMTSFSNLNAKRQRVAKNPVKRIYDTVSERVGELLTEDGADPVAVISGGTKWAAAGMLSVAADRRIPCIYKTESAPGNRANPWVLRFDGFRPTKKVSQRHFEESFRLVMTAGTSLLTNYRREFGREAPCPDVPAFLRWVEGKDAWRLSAELTAYEAWANRHSHHFADGEMPRVALIRSQSEEGRVCAEVVKHCIEMRGATVITDARWDVPFLSNESRESLMTQTEIIGKQVADAMGTSIDEMTEGTRRPEVVFSGGQKLTASILQLVGMMKGARVFIAPEAGEGEPATLWLVPAPDMADSEVANLLPGK